MFGRSTFYFRPYQRPIFYQSLAFHITEAIRSTIHAEDLDNASRLEAIRALNEIQARITMRLHGYNVGGNSWSDRRTEREVEYWAEGMPHVQALMRRAANRAFKDTVWAFDPRA